MYYLISKNLVIISPAQAEESRARTDCLRLHRMGGSTYKKNLNKTHNKMNNKQKTNKNTNLSLKISEISSHYFLKLTQQHHLKYLLTPTKTI